MSDTTHQYTLFNDLKAYFLRPFMDISDTPEDKRPQVENEFDQAMALRVFVEVMKIYPQELFTKLQQELEGKIETEQKKIMHDFIVREIKNDDALQKIILDTAQDMMIPLIKTLSPDKQSQYFSEIEKRFASEPPPAQTHQTE